MVAVLAFVRKNLHWLMVAVILLGLLNLKILGGFVLPKSLLVGIVIFLVIYPVMINTRFDELFAHFKEPRPIFCSLLLNFVISPLIAWGLIGVFFKGRPELSAALCLVALLPTSAMSAAWTAFSGARMATALYLIPANLLFSAFIGLPFIFPVLMGDAIPVNKFAIIKNILLVFLTPLILGDITRRILIRFKGEKTYQNHIKPQLGGISGVGVLILLFLVMSLKRNAVLLNNMEIVWIIIVPVALYYLLMYGFSVGWSLLLIRGGALAGEKAVVIVYTSVARHINISLALVLSTFPLDSATLMILLLILAYILQVPSLAFYAQHHGKKMVAMHKKG
ncbi:Arsenical-resistance protein ACR3 [Desulfosarcina cetonica]|uniref:arsenic resistance protein n=1 Tax=Desulfosarcina cetonica TaxID=90730 RepID=UPI0006D0EF91|nr:bile acid:sodium symporter [Desulfosarcina cetonica]VTR69424.1 Arsenical-resistance protein ACR3 [Desulfosarcina cetonica]